MWVFGFFCQEWEEFDYGIRNSKVNQLNTNRHDRNKRSCKTESFCTQYVWEKDYCGNKPDYNTRIGYYRVSNALIYYYSQKNILVIEQKIQVHLMPY